MSDERKVVLGVNEYASLIATMAEMIGYIEGIEHVTKGERNSHASGWRDMVWTALDRFEEALK